jgi:hypothetical protein
MPVGVVHGGADEGAGVGAVSDFGEPVRGVVQIRGRRACLGLAAAVAEEVVGVGLRGAVVRGGQAVEVVVGISPGLGDAGDDFGLPAASALVVEGVEVAGEDGGVVEVLLLFEPAVLEPGLGSSVSRGEALLGESAAGAPFVRPPPLRFRQPLARALAVPVVAALISVCVRRTPAAAYPDDSRSAHEGGFH